MVNGNTIHWETGSLETKSVRFNTVFTPQILGFSALASGDGSNASWYTSEDLTTLLDDEIQLCRKKEGNDFCCRGLEHILDKDSPEGKQNCKVFVRQVLDFYWDHRVTWKVDPSESLGRFCRINSQQARKDALRRASEDAAEVFQMQDKGRSRQADDRRAKLLQLNQDVESLSRSLRSLVNNGTLRVRKQLKKRPNSGSFRGLSGKKKTNNQAEV